MHTAADHETSAARTMPELELQWSEHDTAAVVVLTAALTKRKEPSYNLN
jgi:hypothetical protein